MIKYILLLAFLTGCAGLQTSETCECQCSAKCLDISEDVGASVRPQGLPEYNESP